MKPPADQPVVAGATGRYREFRPAMNLERHFRCVWTNELIAECGSHVAVVPDGCVDLIWIDGKLSVAGPDVAVTLSLITPGSAVIGIRFRPGAAANWLGFPMTEIVGSRVALDDLWGSRAHEIARVIGDAPGTTERMRTLELALGRLAPDVAAPSPDMEFVFNALRTESAGAGMAIILDRLAVSPRTLRRRCQHAFGYGPKTLDRILRFQRFLGLARRAEQLHLADLAFAAGYADQAHLTREVRRLSGFSPATILSQLAS